MTNVEIAAKRVEQCMKDLRQARLDLELAQEAERKEQTRVLNLRLATEAVRDLMKAHKAGKLQPVKEPFSLFGYSTDKLRKHLESKYKVNPFIITWDKVTIAFDQNRYQNITGVGHEGGREPIEDAPPLIAWYSSAVLLQNLIKQGRLQPTENISVIPTPGYKRVTIDGLVYELPETILKGSIPALA